MLPARAAKSGRLWHAGLSTAKPAWAGKSRSPRSVPNPFRELVPQVVIASIRAERLQDITEADAIAEGVLTDNTGSRESPIQLYKDVWNSLHAKDGHEWDTNPWVWVLTFRLVVG